MAIVQISRITNRKGRTENLPQLAGAELGWCVDSRRLFIGNGTLQEGAPVIGNTEILTEFSDITVLSDYTYQDIVVGYAAQTGPSPSSPIVRSVQAKLDDIASIRDFGAVGDGITDDTAAINRALFQLYCRENNAAVRRMLYFPAGVYRITETIIIPTYAKLVGEGADHSIILLDTSADISTLSAYVARYGDSQQQTGANIGTNGAEPPRNIEISSLSFQSNQPTDIFLVDQATQCWFQSVNFRGPFTSTDIEDVESVPLPDVAAIRFNAIENFISNDITFDLCGFYNMPYAFRTTQEYRAITVSNSKFDTLYQGISIPSGTGTAFRAVHNMFDNIYAEAILFGTVNLNLSAYNVFYNVGLALDNTVPATAVIRFENSNNVSANDLFQRTDQQNFTIPRVQVIETPAVAGNTSGGTQLQLGTYARTNGRLENVINGAINQLLMTVNANDVRAFDFEYTLVRGGAVRKGVFTVVPSGEDSAGVLSSVDDYVENDDTNVTLFVSQSLNQVGVYYSAQETLTGGVITFSMTHLA